MYTRTLKTQLRQKFFSGKALLLTGARQTGKTTLSLELIHETVGKEDCKFFNCDNPTNRELLTNKDIDFLRHLVGLYASQYFWRTYDGSEVDLVEEREGKLYGYEFKWGKKTKANRKPLGWLEYPESSFQYVTPNDLISFVL